MTSMQLHPCEVAIDPNGLNHLSNYLSKWKGVYTSAVVISDDIVYPLYGERVAKQLSSLTNSIHPIIVPNGEPTKTLETAKSCWTQMHALGVDRKSLLISLGGGVISDLAGFVASCYMRGTDVIHIPTTLMGMVDAAIGGKTAVNLPQGKNLIGTIHHPKMIFIDPGLVSSLDLRQVRAGIAEVIKYGLIWDPELFNYLEENLEQIIALQPEKIATIISRSCMIKTAIVQKDEKDLGIRAILNYGHTFSHAIETATEYQSYLHGEALAIGMSCAAHLSAELGYVDDNFINRQDQLIHRAGLKTQLPHIDLDKLISLMAADKKANAGALSCIVCLRIGKAAKINDIPRQLIKNVFKRKEKIG